MTQPRVLIVLLIGFLSDRIQADPISIPYTLNAPGQVSLAVYDSSNHLVRTLLTGEKQTAGNHSVVWDGLDRNGFATAAGEYHWRLLETPGFSREFLVNLGIQTPWAPYGVWPGNHFGPNCLKLDEDGALFVGAVSSEGPPALLKMSLDGKDEEFDTGTWGLGEGLRGIAHIGEALYLLMGEKLEIRRATDVTMFYGHPKLRRFAEQRIPFADLLHAGDDRGKKKVSPMSLAQGKDFLIVTYQDYDEIRLLTPREDGFAKDETLLVKRPRSAAVAPDGRIFVVSGNSIVKVDPETAVVTPVVKDIPGPGQLAYDPQFDDLLVASEGKCVRRFHAADGKPIAVYGRAEGRTYGEFNPLDFDDILDIVADGKGGFVTCEQYPRRVAHFSGREKHTLVNQWIGGLQWGSFAFVDPADASICYLPIDPKHLGRGKIDFAKKSWTLTHLYDIPNDVSWMVGKERHRAMLPPLCNQSFWEVSHRAGKTFLVNRGRGHGAGCSVLRIDEQANRLVPVAHVGGMHPTVDRNDPPQWWLDATKRLGFSSDSKNYKHFSFSWSDTNQNGKIDNEEIKLGSDGLLMGGDHCFIAENWDVYICAQGEMGWRVLANEGTAEIPAWDWNHVRSGEAKYEAHDFAQARPSPVGIWRDPKGATYLIANNGGRQDDRADIPPTTWPNNVYHSSRVIKFDAGGQAAFSVGRHSARKDAPPGEFAHIRAILAQVKDCIVVMDACSPASVWTADGLYAGALNDDTNLPADVVSHLGDNKPRGGPVDWQAMAYKRIAHDDNQWGQVVQTADGGVLWGVTRDNNTPFYKITGWDGWQRQQGKIAMKGAMPAAARQGKGLSAEYFAAGELKGEPALKRVDPAIWFGPMWGDHREVATKNPWFRKDEVVAVDPATCSVRWTGQLEPVVSEEYTFHIYIYGGATHNRHENNAGAIGAKVRLWIDGKLIVDSWENVTPGKISGFVKTRWLKSTGTALAAGKRVPIKIEYSAPGDAEAHLHLYWESGSTDLRHVPTTALYPTP